jgi:hypothetical protein
LGTIIIGTLGSRFLTTTFTNSSKATTVSNAQTTGTVATSLSVTSQQPKIGSVDYYLSLLQSNGTSPYSQLAVELRKLPDLTNSTAVAQIAYLALNSTKPEVKQAFELMVKDGTPNPGYFVYQVSPWNAELWTLYHLSENVAFQKDDVLALVIAIDDGVFTVIGDDAVRNQVRQDDANMLRLSREIMKWQESRFMVPLSSLPLDAALYWGWRGTLTTLSWEDGGPLPLGNYVYHKMPLNAYLWDTIDPHTLGDMRADIERLGWVSQGFPEFEVDSIVKNVEEYSYFTNHWEYHYNDGHTINVYGVNVTGGNVLNTNWQYYERFKKGLPGFGWCVANAAFVDTWLKSVGIAADSVARYPQAGGYTGHAHVIYYNPVAKVWKAYQKEAQLGLTGHQADVQYFIVLRLPIDYQFSQYKVMYVTPPEIQAMFVVNGVSSQQMHQWVMS